MESSSGSESLFGPAATPPYHRRGEAVRRAWADVVAAVAAVLLIFSALFQLLQGISAIAGDAVLADPSYSYRFNTTAWGWIQVVLAVLIALVGVGILMRRSWGQVTGLVVVGLAMVVNFAFIPYYPVWALIALAVNVLVIWALVVQLGEPPDAEPPLGASETGPPASADTAEK